MNLTVIKAIFKRDFISYFSNPTGYVFICVFVMLSAIAAFWPPEFFNNNLANLDQLSRWMPFILLVFIPAITMSTWSEERRQGTDELLLTLPATDFDVVMGKYKAGVAIFTVALVFSMLSIGLVFSWGLGTPDMGLFLCTYLGYWFLGIAMLAVGMVASFLTRNLTVGFVLGMIFNSPLAIFGIADWVVRDPEKAQLISRWSADAQLADFERGVISLSGVTYFISIAIVMLYICMVLIGKRHWGTGEDGDNRWGHYFARAIALLVIFGGLNVFISHHNSLRADVTSEGINSLSPATESLLADLRKDESVDTILVDAYVSPTVPSEYAAHKLNLLGTLEELESMSGGKIQTNVYEVENFSEEADTAENAFGITPTRVNTMSRGVMSDEEIFMGVAVRHKLDKVVVPFIDKGIPVEYELVRSITTVAKDTRKRIGVIKTDAELFGGFSMQGATEESRLVAELRKQYDVVEVDPEEPITDDFDALLAVQPSATSPAALNNIVDAVKRGLPIAVFEDPMPMFWNAPGTGQPRTSGGGPMAMFGGGQQQPKGDINQLWQVLGVEMNPEDVILQQYNPYPQYPFPRYFVFVDEGLEAYGAPQPFSKEVDLASGFKQVLTVSPGALRNSDTSKLEFKPLAVTGNLTATVPAAVVQQITDTNLSLEDSISKESYILSALIEGERENTDDLAGGLSLDEAKAAEGEEAEGGGAKPTAKTPIKAVVVTDIDCLFNAFFEIRARGGQGAVNLSDLDFQNVAFVLNTLDYLAGDDRFLEIRKRSRPHRVLTKIEDATSQAREDSREKITDARDQLEDAEAEANQQFQQAIDEIRNNSNLSQGEKEFKIQQVQQREQRKLNRRLDRLQKDLNSEIRQTQRTLEKEIRGVQDRYKFYAAVLPPILPILLGILVFFHRRSGEREGVSKSRLRFNQKEQDAAA